MIHMVAMGDPALPARFWAKVDSPTGGHCWEWIGWKESGYGRFNFGGRGQKVQAHRFAYEVLVGPIPDGLDLDHRCRVRHCVNPNHLEPVTNAENHRRGMGMVVGGLRQLAKTHCPREHEYSGENLYVDPKGRHRRCRACDASRHRQARCSL